MKKQEIAKKFRVHRTILGSFLNKPEKIEAYKWQPRMKSAYKITEDHIEIVK